MSKRGKMNCFLPGLVYNLPMRLTASFWGQMKKHFYIFRHGQTIWNAEGRPQGQHPYPVPLTMTGREQAEQLAQKLSDKKIKKLISSDLLRAKQTAEIVAGKLGLEVEFDARLREVDYGKLNGMYTIEREEKYPDFRKCYTDYSASFPEGESFGEVGERMKAAIREAALKYNNRSIAVSSHGNAMTVLLNVLFGRKLYRLANCDFIHLTYDPDKDLWMPVDIPPEQPAFEPSFLNY